MEMKIYETPRHVIMEFGNLAIKIRKTSENEERYIVRRGSRIIAIKNPITRMMIPVLSYS